jgi:hypothetical protein
MLLLTIYDVAYYYEVIIIIIIIITVIVIIIVVHRWKTCGLSTDFFLEPNLKVSLRHHAYNY